ncbi:GntR family transcriptional regulator [Shewanella corallii]|uniref:GntR family transcriptional regulator n=1 Tax=Shewanella corallii TaxID=560080 RepID=A0ABT0N845_9GAMM|nr:GntR family transcriptional regulator [Shewanella corallii]MCL2914638.1 GntR family transcriptional regulator [Shewanella corallii]
MKIVKQSLEGQTTQYLRQAIIDGHIGLGEKLVESNLAKELDLSRSTIRMALNSLVHDGLVVQKPYSGWHVISIEREDLWELYNLRLALEGQAAEMATLKASENDKLRLKALFEEYCQLCIDAPTDIQAVSEMDWRFHQLVVEISGSDRMKSMYERILYQLKAYIGMTHQDYDLSQSGECHRALVEAICSGDGDLAHKEARANITLFSELRSEELTAE